MCNGRCVVLCFVSYIAAVIWGLKFGTRVKMDYIILIGFV